jgi:glutathione S-transferase
LIIVKGAVVSDSIKIGEYLDKAYPDTPRLSPAGTAAFQRVFEEYAGSLLISTLRWYALPGSYANLNSASKGYFRRTKEETLGKTLEEVTPKGELWHLRKWGAF